MKHDAVLELNDKYCYSTTGPDYTLYVNSVRWYDSGCYKCMVDGKLVCQSELVVLASQQAETSIGAPTFLSRPEPRVVEVGDDILLSSTPDGMPTPTVRWERDGEVIRSEQGKYEMSLGKGKRIITYTISRSINNF